MASALGLAFLGVFPIVNPIGSAPVFYSLTSGEGHNRRREPFRTGVNVTP